MSQIRNKALRELGTVHSTGDIREQLPRASLWTCPVWLSPEEFSETVTSRLRHTQVLRQASKQVPAKLSRHHVLQTQTRRTELDSSWQVPSAQTKTEQSTPSHRASREGPWELACPVGVVLARVCVYACVCAGAAGPGPYRLLVCVLHRVPLVGSQGGWHCDSHRHLYEACG